MMASTLFPLVSTGLRRRVLLAALLLSPLSARGQGAGAGPATPAEALNAGLLTIMHAGRATPFATRAQTLAPAVQAAFDLPLILRNSVGPRFASFPPAQQAQLLDAFTAFTIASYVANFDSFEGQRFDILPELRRAGADEVVQTRFVPTTGEPVKLDYVVRRLDTGWKIVDVLLDGAISRVAVQRSDFRALVGAGDAAPLIDMLHSKVAGLASGEQG